MSLQLFSTAFDANGPIPVLYTCQGSDISPPIGWSDPPSGTLSFVLLCIDPDAPRGDWYHWAVYDIPAWERKLPERLPAQAPTGTLRQGMNDFGRRGYGGPCPPPGHKAHRYRFELLALSIDQLALPDGAGAREIEAAARPYALATARLIGVYARQTGVRG